MLAKHPPLEQIIRTHQVGKLDCATKQYQQYLKSNNNPHVHYLLSTILLQKGLFKVAKTHATVAFESNPLKTSYQFQLALINEATGDFESANHLLEKSLKSEPRNFHFLKKLAHSKIRDKQYNQAIHILSENKYKLLISDKDLLVTLVNAHTALNDRINALKAIVHYLKNNFDPELVGIAIRFCSDNKFLNIGIAYYKRLIKRGHKNQFASLYASKIWIKKNEISKAQKLLQQEKDSLIHFSEFWLQQSSIQLKHEETNLAIASLHRSICLDPKNQEALLLLAKTYQNNQNYRDAEKVSSSLISIEDKKLEYYLLQASIYRDCGKISEGIDLLNDISSNFSDSADLLLLQSDLEIKSTKGKDSYSLLPSLIKGQNAESLEPKNPQAHFTIANIYMEMAMPDKALPHFRKGIELEGYNYKSESSLIFNSLYDSKLSQKSIYQACKRWSDKYELIEKPFYPRKKSDLNPKKKLKIGYISPDFCLHPVGYFLKSLFLKYPCTDSEIYCFSNRERKDELQTFFKKQCSHWYNIEKKNDQEVADLIFELKIDILVDLAGHTSQNSLKVMALKPAPVQVSWLGFPGTTGLRSIDYRFSDAITEPLELCQPYSSEKIYHLPDGFHCYRPQYNFPDTATEIPAIRNQFITFGSFNNLRKISDQTFNLWAEVLKVIPNSKLIIKSSYLKCRESRLHFLSFFDKKDISSRRIEIIEFCTSNIQHLENYKRIDIALDSFPYNGTTTTCEALYMGVPVITLLGDHHVSRVSASILNQLGMHDWIAKNQQQYIALAIEKSGSIDALKKTKINLRNQFENSTLFDNERFKKNLHRAYRNIWQNYCLSNI